MPALSESALDALQSLDALDATGEADHPDFPAMYAYATDRPITTETGETLSIGAYVRVVEFKTQRGFSCPDVADALAHVGRARNRALAAGCDALA